ncbi:ribulose-1,5 bisphosphate carboxylase/oxygenase large subunit N-methyltransferase, chloroplastic [Dorcoceras hygrometricum]|uniref:Ribulose-1,5 bisphosphate carboxylase/oxygenase large subunit N-methyltransferase, chloroplastic n=1 Tax=Dorcoceras hygrometricum TaxID=472368 RepID=A0A2Z7CNJ5_9LAMI|nr:ribulose-1,5 bisphosphate carboxylase/oxygenase large subunit N-methyltransferase, chloroplastic [Dorcoceras hygrometricum]
MPLRYAPVTNTLCTQTQYPVISIIFRRFTTRTRYFPSISPPKGSLRIDEECDDFLPWLERKAGKEISSVLAIGTSSFGRSLYASHCISEGDCILKIPHSVQMAPDNLPSEISYLLGDKVGSVAKVALLILLEKQLGQVSEWAPYISRLPNAEKMHSTIFWSNDELEMIRPCALYRETLKQKTRIGKDFTTIKEAFDGLHNGFQDITLQEFTYAHGLDFLNHDGTSEAYLLSNELKQHSEVLADRDYAPGDEVDLKHIAVAST